MLSIIVEITFETNLLVGPKSEEAGFKNQLTSIAREYATSPKDVSLDSRKWD